MSHDLVKKRDHIRQLYGDWTAHNIDLGEGVSTMPHVTDRSLEILVAHTLQTAQDVLRQKWSTLKVLDLGCLEGGYAIEFARHGAQVVGVEARHYSLEKARFAALALGLTNVQFVQADVRNIDAEWLGTFDVVLCLGILYHLPGEDILPFLGKLKQMCRGALIIDTHVALTPQAQLEHEGRTYAGSIYLEHQAHATAAQKVARAWASIDNCTSFWLTRPSLFNALHDLGFTSIFENMGPMAHDRGIDRINVVALATAAVAVHRHGHRQPAQPPAWAENNPRFVQAPPLPPMPTAAALGA